MGIITPPENRWPLQAGAIGAAFNGRITSYELLIMGGESLPGELIKWANDPKSP
jgi:hypothetical protein